MPWDLESDQYFYEIYVKLWREKNSSKQSKKYEIRILHVKAAYFLKSDLRLKKHLYEIFLYLSLCLIQNFD